MIEKLTPKLKQTRARSDDKKADQFERILEAGKELFLEKGTSGFSMRNLAEMLGMTKNNLYNYVTSKRELWVAIRNKFYNQFREENLEIVKKHKGPTFELIIKLYEHFLDFAARDYDKFRMMFNIVDAPHSNKIGPIESKYREYRLLDGTTRLIQQSVDKGEINGGNSALLSLFTFSLVMGVSYIEMARAKNKWGAPSPVWETFQLSQVDITSETVKECTLKVIEEILKKGLQ